MCETIKSLNRDRMFAENNAEPHESNALRRICAQQADHVIPNDGSPILAHSLLNVRFAEQIVSKLVSQTFRFLSGAEGRLIFFFPFRLVAQVLNWRIIGVA